MPHRTVRELIQEGAHTPRDAVAYVDPANRQYSLRSTFFLGQEVVPCAQESNCWVTQVGHWVCLRCGRLETHLALAIAPCRDPCGRSALGPMPQIEVRPEAARVALPEDPPRGRWANAVAEQFLRGSGEFGSPGAARSARRMSSAEELAIFREFQNQLRRLVSPEELFPAYDEDASEV